MTWNDVVSEATKVSDQIRADGSVPWFRGHRDESFEIKATIHRHIDLTSNFSKPLDNNERLEILREEYKTLYRRFKADAWPMLDPGARSEWGIIFTMQHYGLPTRLLDWTESFACAVFFALLNRAPQQDAAIWVLDPQALNSLALQREGLVSLDDDTSPGLVNAHSYHPKWVAPSSPLPSIAVSPLFINARMTAQRSAFTLSGDSPLSLDREFPKLDGNRRLSKIPLPATACADASSFLALAGLTAFSFYPDLNGLAMRHEAESQQKIVEGKRWYPRAFK